jgi:hypothetical protein
VSLADESPVLEWIELGPSDEEYEAFIRTRLPLLLYAARRMGLDKGATTVEALKELSSRDRFAISVALCDHPDIMDDYLRENPDGLSAEDLGLVDGYRHALHGDFIILRHLRRHTVLVGGDDPPVAYGVIGLTEELEDVFPDPPVMVETVLLPFRGKITFDGIIFQAPVSFGPGVRSGFEQEYRDARARFGIVMSLPFSLQERALTDEARLRALTRSWRGVRENWEAIREIFIKDQALFVLYHQRLGMLAARDHRKRLREESITEGWFATLDGTLVGGGTTREDVERTVEALVPRYKREHVHIYKALGK